jgi:hypothetical protein
MPRRVRPKTHRIVFHSDWTRFGVGVAVVALFPLVSEALQETSRGEVASGAILLAGISLLITSFFRRDCIAEYEKPWREQLSQFRDRTERFVFQLDEAWRLYQVKPVATETWRDLARQTPWPAGDDQPLYLWRSRFYDGAPNTSKQLYDFVEAVRRLTPADVASANFLGRPAARDIDAYRRFAVDVFEDYADYLDAGVPGFEAFLSKNAFSDTFLEIMVVVAFLQIVAEAHVRHRLPVKTGVWRLGRRWHPTMQRSTDRPRPK